MVDKAVIRLKPQSEKRIALAGRSRHLLLMAKSCGAAPRGGVIGTQARSSALINAVAATELPVTGRVGLISLVSCAANGYWAAIQPVRSALSSRSRRRRAYHCWCQRTMQYLSCRGGWKGRSAGRVGGELGHQLPLDGMGML